MKFSESWLREWVNPSIDTAELMHQLTMAGLEVDGHEAVAGEFSGVVVGQILSFDRHPDADKLNVCVVDTGDEAPSQIVCGAPNVKQGMKIPVAKVGAVLPGNFKIKKAKLRGVESFGMCCAEEELGLSDSSDGLMELREDAPVGTCFREYMGLDDVAIDVDLTPNRGDCLSIAGLAREVGTLTRTAVTTPEILAVEAVSQDVRGVTLEAPSACPRYAGRVVKNVDVKAATPIWIQEKLRRSGIRSIDPIVDITNFVLLELGQPMHAFDLNKLEGDIRVRMSEAGEKLTLLDGQEVELTDGTLVIADQKSVLAMAGVMGGEASSVTSETKDILFEAAYFDQIAIAGKARSYGLHTDSSHRFERGVDFKLQEKAIERATQLLVEIAGGEPGPVFVEENTESVPAERKVVLASQKVESLLGLKISDSEIEEILTRLGLVVSEKIDAGWVFEVPSYRFDISIEEDLIEEVGRIYGYNNLPRTLPVADMQLLSEPEVISPLSSVRAQLVSSGYQEAITYSFIEPKLQKLFDPEIEPKALANPISADMAVMRTSLLPGLAKALQYNAKRQQSRIRLFETGQVFIPQEDQLRQVDHIAGVVYGARLPERWNSGKESVDFFDVKGDIEAILGITGALDSIAFEPASDNAAFHPGQTAKLMKGEQLVGYVGTIHPNVGKLAELPGTVIAFELELGLILEGNIPEFKDISKFPEVRRDLAVIVDESVNVSKIKKCIEQNSGEFMNSLSIFDVYQGKGIEEGHKSIALGLTWQHPERTLNDEEINQCVESIVNALDQEYQAKLRS
ncbi:phenylalanine--tRNA ligase subunit beta [Litoribrevibacter albus]|uniref:Phenylalanine--tRNA ligase beta subunit n=1 Tax=Litoribrevibacter albus TaxID=1473156 RepID=A0AA37S9B9_9GAMM|nr:phenylalanine--tRNA ligase subunit beta [Litoribrevibacter albus]GLQ30951.1 phenylalanine--tRNA ligase beta subunit [Litoribrevibacter albus]